MLVLTSRRNALYEDNMRWLGWDIRYLEDIPQADLSKKGALDAFDLLVVPSIDSISNWNKMWQMHGSNKPMICVEYTNPHPLFKDAALINALVKVPSIKALVLISESQRNSWFLRSDKVVVIPPGIPENKLIQWKDATKNRGILKTHTTKQRSWYDGHDFSEFLMKDRVYRTLRPDMRIEEVATELANCDFLVDTNLHDPYPIVLLMAGIMNVPIACTRTAFSAEHLDNGSISHTNVSYSLASLIDSMSSSKPKPLNISQKLKDKFSFAAFSDAWRKLAYEVKNEA